MYILKHTLKYEDDGMISRIVFKMGVRGELNF